MPNDAPTGPVFMETPTAAIPHVRQEKVIVEKRTFLIERPVDSDRIERVVNGIVRRLESSGESEIPTTVVGEMVMDALSGLDKVAYVRFASVYRNFREAKDFEEFVGKLGGDRDND